jgi:hypothetical protein
MLSEAVCGERKAGANVQTDLRSGPYSALVTCDAHGKYFEACRNGRVFAASTAAAGFSVANATFVGPVTATSTPIIGLFNPAGSSKALVVIACSIFYVPTAETAIALPQWNVIQGNAGITAAGANVTFSNGRLDITAGSSIARGFANTALTGAGNGIVHRSLIGNTLHQSSATVAATVSEFTDGCIIITPGAFAGILVGGATPATSSMGGSIVYEEVDWPL